MNAKVTLSARVSSLQLDVALTRTRSGGEHRGQDRRHRHEGQREGEQPVDELVAAVVVAGRLGDLRDEDGVEDAPGEQQVELVGQRVGDVEGVTGHREAHDGGEHEGLDHAEDARDDRPRGHDRAGAGEAALAAHGRGPAGEAAVSRLRGRCRMLRTTPSRMTAPATPPSAQ